MMEKEKILAIIQKIQESEDIWKAQYMAMWNFIYYLQGRGNFDEKFWKEKLKLGLPASEKKYYEISPERLVNTLGPRDNELKYIHLVNLFSLFESIPTKNRDSVLSNEEVKELELAKETRNCYVHGNKIDDKWLKAYQKARGKPTVRRDDELDRGFTEMFHEIEKWTKLIIDVSHRIKADLL